MYDLFFLNWFSVVFVVLMFVVKFKMSAVQSINPNADLIGSKHTQFVNIGAAKSLQGIVQTNLGPRGTMKM